MIYDRNITACFTGHRVVRKDFDIKQVDEAIIKLIEKGYVYFLNGMAIGFDMLSFKRLLKIKNEYPEIKIIACIPCVSQSEKYPSALKKEYKKLLEYADEKVYVSQEYTEHCMKERDRYMVDNSSVCMSYLYKSTGGAYYTTKYALEKDLDIIYFK